MIDQDELRKEVAVAHGVLLGVDDPVLVTVTLHDLVLQRHLALLNAQAAEHMVTLSAALKSQSDEAKRIGGQVVTEAADYVSAQVRQAVETAVAEAAAKLKAELADAQNITRRAGRDRAMARTAGTMALIGAGIAGVCALAAAAAVAAVLFY